MDNDNVNKMNMNDKTSSQTTSCAQFAGVIEKDLKAEIVEDNLKYFSASQRKKAKAARKMMQDLGTPTSADLKALIRMNMIRNCDVNTEDVNLADRAYRKDVSSVKGKSTRANPKPINNKTA